MSYSIDPTVDPDAAATRAHVLLESEIEARISAVRELARHRIALHAVLAAYEGGWQTALKAGWTTQQLRQIGLKEAQDEKAPEAAVAESLAPVAPLEEPEEAYPAPIALHSTPVAESAPTYDAIPASEYTANYEPSGVPAAAPYTY